MDEKVKPQAPNEGRQYVYNKLKEKGYNVGEYSDFDTAMSNDEDSRRWAYDELGKSGIDLGGYDQFESGIGYVKPTEVNGQKASKQKHSIQEATAPKLEFPKLDKNLRMVDGHSSTPLLKTEQYLEQVGTYEDGTPAYETKQRAALVPDFDPQNGGVTAPPAYLDVRTGKTIKATDKRPEVQRAKDEAKRKPEQITNVGRATRDSLASLDADIDKQMSQAIERVTKDYVDKAKDPKHLWTMAISSGSLVPGGAGMAGGATTFDPNNDTEVATLKEAKRRLNDARNIIAEADHNAQSGTLGKWLESSFAGGAARGFGQKLFDARTWDFGLRDLAGNLMVKSALDKADAGKSLTKAEMMLLDALSVEMATNAYFGSYVGHGYKAGGVTAEAIPFMLEFVMNPLSSTGSSATNKLARYAIKRYGLKVAKGAGQKALRVGGRVLGDVAGAAGMTMTTGAVRTAADVVDRTTGDVHFGLNDNDRIVYDGHEKGEDLGTAIYKGVASRTIENYSEMFGNYLGPLLGGAGRIVSKGASKVPYLRRATEFIGKVNGSQFGRMVDDLMTKTQWQGAPAEYAEEVAGNVMNALLVGDKDFSTDKGKGVFNLDDNIETFLGVSLMSGAISMAKTAGYRTPTMEARKSVERSDNKALSAFGDPVRWGDIRSAIDTGIDKEIHNAVAGVLRDKEATEGQKKAVLDYAKRSQEYRGMIEAKRNKLTESGDDATAEDMQTSYENGYTLSTPQQMADAKNNLDYLAYKASSDLGIAKNELSELSEGNIDGSYVQGLRDRGYTDKQIGSVLDWLNAKATYDGLIQNAKDSIADTIQDIHDDIDANTAKDGTLRVATIKDGEGGDKQVYIVDGNVSMLEDGSGVDKANSDDNIIVRDPETGEVKFIHLSSVISAEEAKDPEVEKARLSDEAKQSIAGHFANQIDGKLPLAVGDVYSFATEAGEPYQVSILQDNGDGTMQVEANGAQVQMSREDLQAQADITNQVRVRQYHDEEAQKQEELKNLERAEEGKPTYHLNDQIVVRTPEGVDTVGYIQAEEDEDGRIEVWTDSPINGRRVQLFSRDELDGMLVQHNPAENSSDAETTEEAITEEDEDMDVAQEPEGEELEPEQVTEDEGVAPEHDIEDNTALVGIPLEENGEPAYESVPVSTSYDALMEQTDGDADMVDRVIDSVLSDKRAELKKVEASKVKNGGSVTDKIRAEREREALLEKARGDVAYWEQMKGEREERRIKELQNIDETARVEIGEAPEYHMDNGEDARERGYVNVSGYRIDRQEPISNALFGKEHNVKFATDVAPDAKYAVIDVRELQASHNSGMQNARHFIPEAQPKDRSGSVSVMRSESMARHIKPEEITGGATAYAGAPVVNSRGEVIQGNGRSDALRLMWLHNPDVSEGYKQYLVDHADKFGLDADAIRSMHAPVLVHMVDVDDSEAIRLGQYKMGDIETGGEERIDPAVTAQKMGGDIGVYASLLFASSEEGKSLSDLVSRNGVDVLQWMNRKGYISDNQYSSALNKQGALTTEAREDLKAILYQILFDGRHISIKKDFDDLPKSAQNALLQTVHRAIGLPENSEIIELLQKSIGAYAGLLQYDTFREAKTPEEVAMAIDNWSGMQDLFIDKSNGEIFGNFALKLAEEMRVSTQRKLASLLNELYDVVQGSGEDTLFEASETTPKSLQEAVIQVFGLEDGNNGSMAVADEGTRSESGGHGRPREATSGEPTEVEEGEAQRRGGIDEHSEEVAPESVDTQASDTTGGGYRLSAIAAKRGGNFFENNEGSIDLVKISDNVFEAIGIKPLPMRMTEAMAQHIIKQHAKELGISTQEEAVAFVVDIMQHFDHVREGKKPKTYIFSIEKGRSRTGKRAVTLVLPSKSGEYLGVSSSGYEKVSRLKERALLWEEGANNEAPTTETASVNVTSPSATQGGMTGGSASNQSNALSEGKDSEKNTTEGEANVRSQDGLSIEDKEDLLSKAKQELEDKEAERTAIAEKAIALMKDYYDSGAIPNMDSGEFHGQATLILIGFKDRSNLELMKTPGLSEILPSLYKLADEARAKKVVVHNYENELTKKSAAKKEEATSSVITPDSERYNGYIVTLPKKGKAGAEVGDIEEFVGADEKRPGLMVVYHAPEGFAVAVNGTMAIADKTQFDVDKKGKSYKMDGTEAAVSKTLEGRWQSFISKETRGENYEPFTESPVNITQLSKYLDRVEQDLYNRWKADKGKGLTRDSFKTYRSQALVSIPNGRGGYVVYPYTQMRSMAFAAKRLGVTSFFVEGDKHDESSVYLGVRLVGNGRLGSVVHAGFIFRPDDPYSSFKSELSYLYDESVGVKDIDEGVRMQKGDADELGESEEDSDIRYRYTEREDGTLLSDNALEAEEHGKFPKAKFRKVYGLTPTDFEMMLAIGLIVNSEWHHTGKTFRETKYYSWADNAELDNGFFGRESTLKDGDIYYNMDGRATTENPFYISEEEANTLPLAESALSEWYKAHKKEIKKLADEYKRREWAWETLENVPSVKYDNVDYLKSFIWRRYDPNDYNRDVIGLLSEILSDSMIFDEKKKRQGGDIPRERINAIYDEAYKEAKDIVQEGPDANHDDMYKRILDNHLEEHDYAELINAERMKRNLSEDSKAGILLQLAGLSNIDRKHAIYSIGNFVKYDVLGKLPNYNGYVYRSSSLNDVGNGEVSNSLVRELQFIKDKARADGSFMKAPNGRPTNLTEKQWLQVRTTAFKEWFGDWENDPANASKVVDENGEPMVVYHGTSVSRRRFFKFKDGAPNWFTPSEYYAKAFTLDENIPVMYPSFINIKKILPLGYIDGDVISGKIRSLSLDTGISESSIKYIASKERADKVYQITNSPLFKKEAMALGYDGVTAFEGGVDSFAVFSPSQVKSATENTGSFDGTNDDIRYNSYDVVDKDEYDMQALERVATSMSESLGESTHIVHDTEEIEGRNERETNRMRGAKGWYDFKTGQVVVVLPNHTDEADVARTVLHEIVGHKGIRAVVGDSSFEAFLDKVYKGATTDVRKAIIDRSKRYRWNVRLSTEEYIAELAERGFADREGQGMWNKVKVLFRDMISHVKMLLGFDIGDRELRYMLWRSWQMQHKSGIMAEAENISMQMELGVGNFSSEGNARYRRGTHVPPTEGDGSLKEEYDNLIASSRYQMAEAIQDSMKSVSEVYKMILEKEGKPSDIEDVDGYENAYLGENRLSSVNQAEMEYFSHQVFKPFLDEVGNIVKDGSSYEEVTDYMMSLHGLERNRSMAFDRAVKSLAKEQGDTTLEDRIHREYLEDSDRIANEEAFEARRISADEYHKEDDRIRKSYAGEVYDEYRRVDYAGLTGMDSVYEGVEDAESDALELIREFEDMHDVIKLWSTKRGVTDATRMKLYDTGLISKETEAKLRDMYKYYIPLRGFADGTSEDHYGYLGESRGSFSPAIKKAKGRKSQADDPIAQMSKMFESAVVQGNRNKLVKQKMLNFVTNHPTELFSVSDLWLRYNDVTEEWEPVFPEPMPDGASHEEVEERMRAFEEKMMQAKKDNPSEYKRGAEARNIPYRVLERELNEHQMIVKRGGRSIVVTINGNPRFAQAINGMSNPDSNVGGWVGAIFELGSKVNRVLSALYTTKNPDFLVSNMIRDMLYSNTMVWVKESPSYARRFHANIAKYNPAVLRGLIKKHKAGTLNLEDDTERHFYQFMMNGGETGYTQQRDIEGHKNEIQRALIGSSGRLTAKKAFMLLEKLGDDLNRAVENVARFSAYVASRDEGRSIDRSIYDAKEISVNFNKKGAGSKFYNAYGQTFWGKSGALISGAGRSFYVFWNAAVQGLSNYGRYVGKNPNKGMVHAASFFTLGVVIPLMAYMNGSGDGDDDYWDLPEYVRRSNICFNAGDGTWVTIPLPQEMRAVYGLGELATSTISGKEHMDDMELGKAMVEQMTQVLPLDLMEGGGSLRALYPSFVKPLVEASDNVSWTGSPIYKDTPYNKSDPEWTKAYRTANSSLVWLSKTLNELTGGDDYKSGMVDFNPAQVEYILKGYFGGAWSFTNKLVKSGEIMVGNRDFEWGSIPLANRVVKTSDERTKFRNTNNEYYKYKKEAEEVKRLERKYEKSDNVLDYAKKIDELQRDIQYRRYLTFEDLNAEVELLQKALKEEDDPRKVEELTQALREAKKSLVDSIRNIK